MNKLIVAAIAGAFVATALAQGPAAPQTPPTQAAKPANAKERQELVKGATADTAKGYGEKAAEGSAAAAKTKGTPKALPDKAAKRESVNKTTEDKGYSVRAAEGSAKAKADKTPKQPKPKMGEHQKQLQKASTP
jgi:hypothetical protein